MMRKQTLGALALLLALTSGATSTLAQHSHGHAGMGSGSMKMDVREVLVEGVRVIFQFMANDEHRKMLEEMKMRDDIESGTTHNITVILKDEKTQKEITNASVNLKLVDPKGKDQIKPLRYERRMKSYDGYFNLSEKGKYQVMILFKADDKKTAAGLYYDVK